LNENLANALTFVQEDVDIRCESLKEKLEELKEDYYEEVDYTEKEICE
jgi:hypothetical protein